MILSNGLRPLRWKLRAVSTRQTKKSAPPGRSMGHGPLHALWCLHTSGGIAASEHCRIHIVTNL
jgi:hypothetical protein